MSFSHWNKTLLRTFKVSESQKYVMFSTESKVIDSMVKNSGKTWLILLETCDCSLGSCLWEEGSQNYGQKLFFAIKFEGLNPFYSLYHNEIFLKASRYIHVFVSCLWYCDTYRIC
jgi:hypothetical protein